MARIEVVHWRIITSSREAAEMALAMERHLHGDRLQNVHGPKPGRKGNGEWLVYADLVLETVDLEPDPTGA